MEKLTPCPFTYGLLRLVAFLRDLTEVDGVLTALFLRLLAMLAEGPIYRAAGAFFCRTLCSLPKSHAKAGCGDTMRRAMDMKSTLRQPIGTAGSAGIVLSILARSGARPSAAAWRTSSTCTGDLYRFNRHEEPMR